MNKGFLWFLRIVATIIGAILSLLIAHSFNPFSLMTSVIPQDKVYDVCITVYFSLTELLIIWGLNKIEELMSYYYMDIEALLSHKNETAELHSHPTIRFNEYDMSEVYLTIKIRGTKKYLSDVAVIVPRIVQADYQSGRKSIGVRINNDGDFCVALSDICGQSEKINISETFLITLQRAPVDNDVQITIAPEISPKGKHGRIRFFSNSAIVQLEGR